MAEQMNRLNAMNPVPELPARQAKTQPATWRGKAWHCVDNIYNHFCRPVYSILNFLVLGQLYRQWFSVFQIVQKRERVETAQFVAHPCQDQVAPGILHVYHIKHHKRMLNIKLSP